MSALWSIVSTLIVAYLAMVALMFIMQPSFVYFPYATLDTTPARNALAFEDVYLDTEDGVRLHGWLLPAEKARFTLLFLHGNGGNISHRIDSLEIFHRLGLDTLIIDYRGYGRSEGKPTEQGTYRDAAAAWRFLTEERGVPAERIVVFGRSLGGAVAAWLAERERPRALILESTFTSLPELGAHHYPYLPVRWLSRFRYNTLERLARIQCPVLVVHSRDDEIVPFVHGERLFAGAGAAASFLEIAGGHNDGFLTSGARYGDGLRAFLDGLD